MRRHVIMSLFLFLLVVDSKISRRFKRQTIPSQHIRIHSIDSKVNMDRFINVASMDSRIQLLEKNVNGTFWSASSKMQFDAYDSFVNASFNSQFFHIDIAQCELLFGNSLESLLFMTTNRTSDGHSDLTFSLYDNANMTLTEEGIEFQGINGRRIYVKSETWVKPVEKTITLRQSENEATGETAVELTIVAPVHLTSVRYVGAELLIKYGPNVVQIDPEFKKILVYNDQYSYCLDTKSPGTLQVNFGNGLINLIGGSSDFHVAISPVDAVVNSKYFSKTQVDRGDGPIFISGVPIYETGITVNSLLLTLKLNNDGMLHADATGSETLMKTNIQNVGLTTEHQEIRITGGVPGLVIESGDVRFEVTKLSNPMAFTFLPGFALPEDRFENIGPYSGTRSRYMHAPPPPPLLPPPLLPPVIIAPVVISAPGSNIPPPPPMVLLPPPIPAPAPGPPKLPISLPPDLMKFAADIAPPKSNSTPTTTTSTTPTTTTVTTTTAPSTTTTMTTPTTTTVTTTAAPITTTTKLPKKEKEEEEDYEEEEEKGMSEKERAKAKRRKEKMYREWESEENNVDNDGDTKTETFTYPNGTTVTRLINIRRKVTTKIVYKHRVEEDEDGKNNSTIAPLVFPDPAHLNYTKLATDCKGNTIDFNITNIPETSTGYHLVTFPTVGITAPPAATTKNLPSTDNDLITETTSVPVSPTMEILTTIPTNPVTDLPVTNLVTESSTVVPVDTTETTLLTTEGLSTNPETETTESTGIVSSTLPTSEEPDVSTFGIETTTIEGSSDSSTIDPNMATTETTSEATTNEVIVTETTTEMVYTTEETIESTTDGGTTLLIDYFPSTDNPLPTTSGEPMESSTSNLGSTTKPTANGDTTTQESVETSKSTTESSLTSTESSIDSSVSTTEPFPDSTVTTETYPVPSQLSTDEFVIGHWFSTEEVRSETTTESSEIGITVSLGNVDFATTTPVEDGVPLPNDLNINQEATPGTTASPLVSSTSPELGHSEDGFPEPSFLPPTSAPTTEAHYLILKLKIPESVSTNDTQFTRKLTKNLRRLVRDVSTELKKRRKRSANITAIGEDLLQQENVDDALGIPIKVENITKTLNITVVTFALQFDRELNNGGYELENALHEVGTHDLYRYFEYEPVEKITIDRRKMNEDEKTREILIAAICALGLFCLVGLFYLKKRGMIEKVLRKLDRLRCNALSTHPNAFTPN
ncbi:hypothetical protein GCK72_025658 [Caenorhabditis remanei]|uniref:Uncharacterized protein n=1 Tax=Caenorhabditis remanei TaxID=31234 RepID=A0A6A5G397_CAERE|nr:hypothetical protein GCK72_025658 [Caenorhabditis remanei]KAF1749191.1 hypothetical protein GCK72_025658 [Caenorhabditis remanei]